MLKDPNGLVVTAFDDNTKATPKNNATGESLTVMVTVDGTFHFPKVPAGAREDTWVDPPARP